MIVEVDFSCRVDLQQNDLQFLFALVLRRLPNLAHTIIQLRISSRCKEAGKFYQNMAPIAESI